MRHINIVLNLTPEQQVIFVKTAYQIDELLLC